MIRHIKHAIRHSGWVHKHPVATFLLMAIGGAAVVETAVKATAKAPTTSQPVKAGG